MRINELIKKNWILVFLFSVYLFIFLFQNTVSNFLSSSEFQTLIGESVYQGWLGLVDYLSAHVLLCLVPAFFIAGAINTLIGAESIIKYLSGETKKWLSYFIASVGGFFVEVCSCTILPLFAGIWKRGAGLGIATTFLYAGPAVNAVAVLLTGQRIGWDFAIIRLFLSIVFAIMVGVIMELVFRKEANPNTSGELVINKDTKLKGRGAKVFWITLTAILLVGTAPINENFKYVSISVLVIFQLFLTFKLLSKKERIDWWYETVKFVNDIIPLLLVGVFFAGFLTNIIPQEKFQEFTGENNLLTNFGAVLFGAVAYFPALVEVPIAEGFMNLGMHKGPLMAYLLADPVLSLQGLLIISKLIGKKKTIVYAGSITVLTTIGGFLFGLI